MHYLLYKLLLVVSLLFLSSCMGDFDQSSHNRFMQQWHTNQMIQSQPGSFQQNYNAGAAQYYSTQP